MHGLRIEYRLFSGSLARELAQQFHERGEQGKIAVVTDKPLVLLSATKKQWRRLTRQVQSERSSTLNAIRITELTQRIVWMQAIRFSAKPPDDLLEADITFASAEDFVHIPPICPTIYITYSFDKEKLHMLTSWLPKSSKVIIYGQN